jgi:intracellular multiplication protein IcmV
MSFLRKLGRTIKPLVNFPKWMDAKRLKHQGKYISEVGKSLFVPQQRKQQETFEEAIARLQITETKLQENYRFFRIFCGISLILTLLILGYSFYLFYLAAWYGALVSLVLSGITLASAVRYHFWMYQIKQRRLGCSLTEWFQKSILGKK